MARAPRKQAAPKPPQASAAPQSAAAAARPAGLGVARRGGQGKVFTSKPIDASFAGPGHRANQVTLELDGVFHGEASFEGRVFLNNPQATAETPRTQDNGYAGSFHIFGHGGCLGDPGHCEVNDHNREKFDFRPGHMLTPTKTRVDVTRTLQAIARTKPDVSVTIVPVITAANELCDKENVLRFEGMRLVSYNP
jgi:tyrosinase